MTVLGQDIGAGDLGPERADLEPLVIRERELDRVLEGERGGGVRRGGLGGAGKAGGEREGEAEAEGKAVEGSHGGGDSGGHDETGGTITPSASRTTRVP